MFLGAASDGVLLFRFTRKPLIRFLARLSVFGSGVTFMIFLSRIGLILYFVFLIDLSLLSDVTLFVWFSLLIVCNFLSYTTLIVSATSYFHRLM